jgi:hypothetical protein
MTVDLLRNMENSPLAVLPHNGGAMDDGFRFDRTVESFQSRIAYRITGILGMAKTNEIR